MRSVATFISTRGTAYDRREVRERGHDQRAENVFAPMLIGVSPAQEIVVSTGSDASLGRKSRCGL
jgi:hypothetical protein